MRKAQALSLALTHSDTIPLRDMGIVYALSIDATIQQPREASFVRIVLEDTKGHDYLVAESDRFRNDTAVVQLSQYCEETALLEGVVPARLKCYLAGEATLTLTGIHTSDGQPMRQHSIAERTSIKKAQVQDIVDRINAYNKKHYKLWKAGVTDVALQSYDSGEKSFPDVYLSNFKYYTSGIYEIGERPAQTATRTSSQYAESFDWRDRHGKNWITPIDNQGATYNCSYFAVVGMVEAMTNLYFNDTINLNLSEQSIYGYVPLNASLGAQLQHIRNHGVIDQQSMPNMNQVCLDIDNRPLGNECIQIGNYDFVSLSNYSDTIAFENTTKEHIINYGPCVWGFMYPADQPEIVYGQSFFSHYMTLVGYGTVTVDDVIQNNPFTQIDFNNYQAAVTANAGIIGATYWILKDSYGTATNTMYGHNGFRYVIVNNYNLMNDYVYYIYPTINRRSHTDEEIICEDRDGDGFFNWGISSRPDDRLPIWASLEEDGNDNDENIGPLQGYTGIDSLINYNEPFDIDGTQQIETNSWFERRQVVIDYNYQWTITGTTIFHPRSKIRMCNGSSLIIDGGEIVDPLFELATTGTATIILRNGGKIIMTKRNQFTHPLGIKLEIENGSIERQPDFY